MRNQILLREENFFISRIILFGRKLFWSSLLIFLFEVKLFYCLTIIIQLLKLKKFNLDSCSILLKRHPISTVLLIKIVKINFFFSCTYICIIIKSIVKTEYAYSFTKQMQIFSTHAALISDEAKNKIKIIL